MGLFSRIRLNQRQVEVAAHPWAKNYAIIEIDIPHAGYHDNSEMLSTFSVISKCIKQLNSPPDSFNAPVLPTEKNMGEFIAE